MEDIELQSVNTGKDHQEIAENDSIPRYAHIAAHQFILQQCIQKNSCLHCCLFIESYILYHAYVFDEESGAIWRRIIHGYSQIVFSFKRIDFYFKCCWSLIQPGLICFITIN